MNAINERSHDSEPQVHTLYAMHCTLQQTLEQCSHMDTPHSSLEDGLLLSLAENYTNTLMGSVGWDGL